MNREFHDEIVQDEGCAEDEGEIQQDLDDDCACEDDDD